MDITLQDVFDTALILSGVYAVGIFPLMFVTMLIAVLVEIPLKWMGFPALPSSAIRPTFFLAMVIYAAPCIALAVLGVYAPVHLRIALIIFAILQAPIAALRFGSTMNVGQEFALIMGSKFVAQLLAVQIAHITSGWLETLFFA